MFDVPNRHLSSVVLPAPDGPIMAVMLLQLIRPLMPFRILLGSRDGSALAELENMDGLAAGSKTDRFFQRRATPVCDEEEEVEEVVDEADEEATVAREDVDDTEAISRTSWAKAG